MDQALRHSIQLGALRLGQLRHQDLAKLVSHVGDEATISLVTRPSSVSPLTSPIMSRRRWRRTSSFRRQQLVEPLAASFGEGLADEERFLRAPLTTGELHSSVVQSVAVVGLEEFANDVSALQPVNSLDVTAGYPQVPKTFIDDFHCFLRYVLPETWASELVTCENE